MKFWAIPTEYYSSVALIDSVTGREMTYRELDEAVQVVARSMFDQNKQLVFLFCNNRISDIVVYLAALRAGHTILLLESKMNLGMRQRLILAYEPDILVDSVEQDVSD